MSFDSIVKRNFFSQVGLTFVPTIFPLELLAEASYFPQMQITSEGVRLKKEYKGFRALNKSAGIMFEDSAGTIIRNRGAELFENFVESFLRIRDMEKKQLKGSMRQAILYGHNKLCKTDLGDVYPKSLEIIHVGNELKTLATYESLCLYNALQARGIDLPGVSLENGFFIVDFGKINLKDYFTLPIPKVFFDSRLDVTFMSMASLLSNDSATSLSKARRKETARRSVQQALQLDNSGKMLSFKNALSHLGFGYLNSIIDQYDRNPQSFNIAMVSEDGEYFGYANAFMLDLFGYKIEQVGAYNVVNAPIKMRVLQQKVHKVDALPDAHKATMIDLFLVLSLFVDSDVYSSSAYSVSYYQVINQILGLSFARPTDE